MLVLDTNVIVSAVRLSDSKPRMVLNVALDEGGILLSLPVLKELQEVLGRRKFDRYVLERELREFLTALVKTAKWVEIDTTIDACRDAEDNKFLELAVSGEAECIITGDNDLLVLHPFRGIPIVSPEAFLLGDWRS